ncbi:hypothetical protein ANO14919_061630 [Xylariales sp. No.14919]|nr:hypothetical protein ANO14919_061630 [Xylariales sp. No.14919]
MVAIACQEPAAERLRIQATENVVLGDATCSQIRTHNLSFRIRAEFQHWSFAAALLAKLTGSLLSRTAHSNGEIQSRQTLVAVARYISYLVLASQTFTTQGIRLIPNSTFVAYFPRTRFLSLARS